MTEIDSNSNRWLKLYQSWIVAAKNIKNDDTLADNANISELLDIENGMLINFSFPPEDKPEIIE